jgi:hypothetical protein
MNYWNLSLFSNHCADAFQKEADGRKSSYCPIEGMLAEVVIRKGREDWPTVWDSCYVNGYSVGNRHGLMKALAIVYAICSGGDIENLNDGEMIPIAPVPEFYNRPLLTTTCSYLR